MSQIKLLPYSHNFIKHFENEKQKIEFVISEARVYHIGSTAVEGLGGKGIIDILVAIDDWNKKEVAVKKLKKIGFLHIHPEEGERIFLSRNKSANPKNTHIHLVKTNNQDYVEILLFRDYLRENKDEADKYMNLKQEFIKKAKSDRILYGKLKNKYIASILKKKQIQKLKKKEIG